MGNGKSMAADGNELSCASVMGAAETGAMRRAREFLMARGTPELLRLVGSRRDDLVPPSPMRDKRVFPTSYGGRASCADDLLAGQGMFYVTEGGRVMLDCTSGHYQMTWGYNHPQLLAATREAMELGVVWDNHSNIPSHPVKLLADRLADLGADAGLDRVLLGVCTGSVACGAALKIMLMRYARDTRRARLGAPVMIALSGNYHGTDMVAQTMRGMWPGLVAGMETVQVQPNDPDGLRAAFARCGRRVAGFWAEPIMMNREAIAVHAGFLQLAQELCAQNGALMAIDEIQTGFWHPQVLMYRALGIRPDLVVVGKGMTAGFHPLAGLLYRAELDILEQYDAISTNGSASLASFVALCSLELIERGRERLAGLAERHFEGLRALAAEFPGLVEEVNGGGFLSGIKFRDRQDALGFHRQALARGLWLRAHAYHPGHRTVLMKHPLAVEEAVIDYVHEQLRDLLKTTPWR
jgi:acetylornithine/succinyldiaminopimelate/putrescine aminotransferase